MSIHYSWPESRFVVLPSGVRHHYVAFGDHGPVLVLLHGYADSWRSFEPLLPALAKEFRVLALDQRGHGLTGAADGYRIEDFTQDAIDFLDAVAPEPAHLVGHSLGSIVAQRVAARRRDLVRSLVLIGPAQTAAGNAVLAAVRAELEQLGDDISDDFIEAFQCGGLQGSVRAGRLAVLVAESRRLLPETWRGALDGLLNEPAADGPEELRTPALSLWGSADGVFDRGAQVSLARAIPHLETVHYAGVGHAPHWEIPDQVTVDIVGFTQSIEADRSIHVWQEAAHAD